MSCPDLFAKNPYSQSRRCWERALFDGRYDHAMDSFRPKYGTLNVFNDHLGDSTCKTYGLSYLVLKNVRSRCTFTASDSQLVSESCFPSSHVGVAEHYAHVLIQYRDEDLLETLSVACSGGVLNRGNTSRDSHIYNEVQIHGEVKFNTHIERVVLHEQDAHHADRIQDLCGKHGWNFSTMQEERSRVLGPAWTMFSPVNYWLAAGARAR